MIARLVALCLVPGMVFGACESVRIECDVVVAALPEGEGPPGPGSALPPGADVLIESDEIDWGASSLGQGDVGQPEVTLQFSPEAAVRFSDFTRDHVGEYLSVVLNGRVLLTPVIMGQISGGAVQFAGGQDVEFSQLAACING